MSFYVVTAPREQRIPVRTPRLENLLELQNLLSTVDHLTNALYNDPDLHNRRLLEALQSKQDVGAVVEADKDKFKVNLDVQQFKPEEISVKVTGDNTITVEGKHEERPDEHGFISRQFVRRYVLPKGHDINKLESRLSSDGVLTITAPKESKEQIEHRTIPITQTGQPSRAIQKKPEEGEKKE